ncbi:unnamed protein product (macronuclear) [Paramecium tetraurelia]|uniref:Protein kinase domain-containing protein n=1 Tax=Paramecium tetraurelia TaxID=5888 RepID=A0C3Z7_PARTE|nr:uncharacterized protein GSPATT00034994001 [Paramecium tetraurelia]CAK65514.1 unnamed protein product [Paramecium tetraurelia]|eukprot:XP_001432911.1 hypothetical protein (macronuclear) [Paramecium tetraurelia strain d4-2]
MGVCTSSSAKNDQKQMKTQPETKPDQQISLVPRSNKSTIQWQDRNLKNKAIIPQKNLSTNQTTTPVQINSTKNGTMSIRRASHATTITTKTMIVQSSQLYEQPLAQGSSPFSIQNKRNNIKQGTKSLQVTASKNYSIVSSKILAENLGKTVMQHNETGQQVQVEVLKFDHKNQQYIDKLEEIKLVSITITQDNIHIVKIIDILVDHQKKTYQVMYECCPGGSLSNYVENRKYDDQQIGIIFYQMIEALGYIHSLGLSHDELTIHSFSVFDDSSTPFIKLSDVRSIYQLMYLKEAQYYEDPISSKHQHPRHSHKHFDKHPDKHIDHIPIEVKSRNKCNDVWALAVIILQLRNKDMPYTIQDIQSFKPEEYLNNYPSEMNTLLLEMLNLNRHDRITLKQCLEHPFLVKMKQVQPQDLLQPLKNMIKCKNMTYLHRCVFWYLLQNYANDHLKILTKLFKTADVDSDGSLSLEELKELFSIEGKDLIDQLNLQQELTLDDFLLLASNKDIILTQDILKSSFKILSRQSNLITLKSLLRVIDNFNELQVQQEFKSFNLNDGLNLQEYTEFIINYETPNPMI